jgi:quercetin dioxygenase-like cupin family protein
MEAQMKYLIPCLMLTLSIAACAQPTESQMLLGSGQGEVKVTQIARATNQWDGSPLPPYPLKNPEITILGYEIPPGVRLPMHRHPVINAGVVLQGTLLVMAKDGKQLTLNPGDSIVELVNQWHYGINQGSEPVKLIMFYVGEVGVPLVIKE